MAISDYHNFSIVNMRILRESNYVRKYDMSPEGTITEATHLEFVRCLEDDLQAKVVPAIKREERYRSVQATVEDLVLNSGGNAINAESLGIISSEEVKRISYMIKDTLEQIAQSRRGKFKEVYNRIANKLWEERIQSISEAINWNPFSESTQT